MKHLLAQPWKFLESDFGPVIFDKDFREQKVVSEIGGGVKITVLIIPSMIHVLNTFPRLIVVAKIELLLKRVSLATTGTSIWGRNRQCSYVALNLKSCEFLEVYDVKFVYSEPVKQWH